MKILTTQDGKPVVLGDGASLGESAFETIEGKLGHDKAFVREVDDRAVALAVRNAVAADEFMTTADYKRDLKFMVRSLVDVAEGTEVGVKVRGRGISLDIPKDAVESGPAAKVGDTVAIGANISPKALMNARGVVTALNGTKVTIKLTAGDRKRIERATGRKYGPTTAVPKSCVDVDDETLVVID